MFSTSTLSHSLLPSSHSGLTGMGCPHNSPRSCEREELGEGGVGIAKSQFLSQQYLKKYKPVTPSLRHRLILKSLPSKTPYGNNKNL